VLTGYGSLETAISAMNYGAFAYVLKPFKFDELLATIESAMNYFELLNSDNIPKKLVARVTCCADLPKQRWCGRIRSFEATCGTSTSSKTSSGKFPDAKSFRNG